MTRNRHGSGQMGAGVQGVGPGTVLGGRYTLRHRLSHGHDLERWSGHDATLEREVALTIIGSEHPNQAGVLDAARRAAGVEDTRLVRILDVGTQSDNSFIVEETMSGSESLATILLQGPLPAEEARRVAGETAKGLETAGQRGLHHLRLTPHHVVIAPDGVIRVSGVAVAAAIDGPDEPGPDAAAASRRDALSLAAVVYAALTSRWPLEERVPGIEPAPRMINGIVAPSEIATGVPADLDALCLMMLNVSAGPLTPGDFANRIAPWSRARVHRDDFEPTAILPVPGPGPVAHGAPGSVAPDSGIPDSGIPDSGIPDSGIPQVPAGTEPTVAMSTHEVPSQDRSKRSALSAPGTPEPGPVPRAGDRAAAAGAATTKALGTAFSSAGAAAGVVGGKLGSLARAASEMGAGADTSRGSEQPGLPGEVSDQAGDDGPPVPMLPASTALPPSRGQTKIVVLVVSAFVVLALFVAFRGLFGPGGSTSESSPTPRRSVSVSAPPATVPASPAETTGATAASPIAILSATGFDPQGDNAEKNGQAARVYDGDLATRWTSEGYNTAQLGNLKKGVGVLLDLGQPTSMHQVTVDLGSGPVDVTVYAATDPNLDGATAVGTASAASGRITLKASGTIPKSQYVIVWFTSLAPDGAQFRASISEIAVN